MRHIIAILLQNEAGALSRVAGLFSTRGYNIESLSVAPTDDPTVSRLTLVTSGSDPVIQQIANQLNKLVDVVNVLDMTRGEHVERELVLLKLKVAAGETDAVRGQVVRSGGRVLDPATEGFIVELTASEAEVNGFVAALAQRGELLEVVRSGALGISRRARPLRARAPPAPAGGRRGAAPPRLQGSSTVEPVVRRPSRSRCASAACASGYFCPMTTRIFFDFTAANSSRAPLVSSARVTM
jgi:acetolactate synthase-1/3 small subunit